MNATFSEADCEAAFEHIRRLITKFREDARWTQKVTDVRHWLDFATSERYRTDDQEKHYYSDSAGKSGGQKAKLAYTILASAIAYQYGLHDPAARASMAQGFCPLFAPVACARYSALMPCSLKTARHFLISLFK